MCDDASSPDGISFSILWCISSMPCWWTLCVGICCSNPLQMHSLLYWWGIPSTRTPTFTIAGHHDDHHGRRRLRFSSKTQEEVTNNMQQTTTANLLCQYMKPIISTTKTTSPPQNEPNILNAVIVVVVLFVNKTSLDYKLECGFQNIYEVCLWNADMSDVMLCSLLIARFPSPSPSPSSFPSHVGRQLCCALRIIVSSVVYVAHTLGSVSRKTVGEFAGAVNFVMAFTNNTRTYVPSLFAVLCIVEITAHCVCVCVCTKRYEAQSIDRYADAHPQCTSGICKETLGAVVL